jgi:hypothetical protein
MKYFKINPIEKKGQFLFRLMCSSEVQIIKFRADEKEYRNVVISILDKMISKNTILTATLLLVFAMTAFAQAKKPIIMVVPSDVWCNKNGYMQELEIQGAKVKVPDYKKALQENADLLLVISKINELMIARGFPLKNLESSIKTLESNIEEETISKKNGGIEVGENFIDKLKNAAKADIWIQMTWTLNVTGPKRSVTFNLQGLDAYTDKQIAGASGTGTSTFSAELPVLLEEAVLYNYKLILMICLQMGMK